MDKETLSNYGWIVVMVLVLMCLLAMATPFGKFISTAVKSTTIGLFQTSDKALGTAGIDVGDIVFEDTDSNSGTDTPDAPTQAEVQLPGIKSNWNGGAPEFNPDGSIHTRVLLTKLGYIYDATTSGTGVTYSKEEAKTFLMKTFYTVTDQQIENMIAEIKNDESYAEGKYGLKYNSDTEQFEEGNLSAHSGDDSMMKAFKDNSNNTITVYFEVGHYGVGTGEFYSVTYHYDGSDAFGITAGDEFGYKSLSCDSQAQLDSLRIMSATSIASVPADAIQ